VDATSSQADAGATRLATKRIALYDTQTGSMPSGWTRFLLERFEFPFKVVCGAGFDDTALRSKPTSPSCRPARDSGRRPAAAAVAVAGPVVAVAAQPPRLASRSRSRPIRIFAACAK
jgi:hypothetical protein